MRNKPLAGIRILDLTRLLPGPVASMHLADLGADVLKIEDTGAGDYARDMGAGTEGEASYFFRLVNRNKRGMRLDLKQQAGREVFMTLARKADVILEGFRPGVVDKLGIGYEAVAAVNPRIVYCAISGYGQTGPYRDQAGHDINYIGYAGVLDQIGVPGGPPAVPNFQIADLLGGALVPLVGLLAALVEARSTGRGRHVDVAMSEAVLAHAIFPLVGLLERGEVADRGDDLLSGGVPCYGVYETADGRYMAVGALEGKFWEKLCEVIRRPDLLPYHLARGAEGEYARSRLRELFLTRAQDEWVALFRDADCCVTPVLTLAESLDNEQFKARGMVRQENGLTQFAPPYQLSDYRFEIGRPAPQPGQHSDEILGEAGYGPEQIDLLRRQGVI